MSKQFEFADFVDEFRVDFTSYVTTEGYRKPNGDYVKGVEVATPAYGIMLPLTQNDLRYSEAGTYSTNDKKIYTVNPLVLGQKIEYKGAIYTIQSFKDYSDYADVFIYLARWREK